MATALQFKIQNRRIVRIVDVESTFVQIVGALSVDKGVRDFAAFGSAALSENDGEA